MKKSDAISLPAKQGNWQRFPVMVWEEGKELVTQVDGKVYRAANMFKPRATDGATRERARPSSTLPADGMRRSLTWRYTNGY